MQIQELKQILTIVALTAIVTFLPGCAAKKLTELDDASGYLSLSEEQTEIIHPKVEEISQIVEAYNTQKEALEEEFTEMRSSMRQSMGGGRMGGRRGGGQPGSGMRGTNPAMQEMQKKIETLRKQQASGQERITILTDEIKEELNQEQLALFEKLELPELENVERPGEGSGGRGGMGGGGRGMGGGRGGGMMGF